MNIKNFQFSIFNFQKRRAFTLVETLVAITILTFAVTGTFLTANNALIAAATSRNQLTASYLAQEGIENVRLLRDNAYLSAYSAGGTSVSVNAWSGFLAGPISTCVAVSCDLGLPAMTGFTRAIRATPLSASDEKITSTVSWSYHGVPYTVTITDHLTPWQ